MHLKWKAAKQTCFWQLIAQRWEKILSGALLGPPDYWAGSHTTVDTALAAAAAAKSLQACLTICDPIDGSPPGSPVPGILQARTLEWGAIAFSNFSC